MEVKLVDETVWSYSRLDCYKQCPFRYLLQYVQKHYVDTNTIATEFGTSIHHAEETIANYIKDGKPIDYAAVIAAYTEEATACKNKYINTWFDIDKTGRTYEEKMQQYLTKEIYGLERLMKKYPNFEILGAEVKVTFDYESAEGLRHFTGSIDRLVHDKVTDIYYVQDVKSWPRIDDHVEKEQTTPLQLLIYSMWVAKEYNIPIENIKCQYDLPVNVTGRMMFPAGTAGYRSRGKRMLNKLFTEITKENWTPSPKALCHWCQFCPTNENQKEEAKDLCPYYCKWLPDNKNYLKDFKWLGYAEHEHVMESYRLKHNIQKDK